jgi:hypothetical protein
LASQVVRIAAVRLDGALAYLRRHHPDFEIGSVQNLGSFSWFPVRPPIASLYIRRMQQAATVSCILLSRTDKNRFSLLLNKTQI